MTVTAIFYDGVSSAPQTIELSFNKSQGVLVYSTPSFQKRVLLTEAKIEVFGSALNVLFGENPLQQIKIEDRNLIAQINAYRKENGQISWYQRFVSLNFPILVVFSLAFLALVGCGYFWGIPWVAEKAVVAIPEDYDNSLGATFYEQYIETDSVNIEKTKLLNQFAQELKLNNTKKLHFTVVESEIINAFALPDGNIVVYSGLLNLLEKPEELVGLIGHETSHVNQRHSMKMLCRNLSGYLLISTVFNDVNGITAVIGENLHSLQNLSYSRKFETQADRDAVTIMEQNHIDPKGMQQLFSRLQSHHDIEMPELMSSHPITRQRKRNIENLIKEKPFTVVENPKLNVIFQKLKE
ncbi:M48 family metallopeptidase [Flavobacterium sp. SM15]|uniref:M48 family metallopeptidase n=1 Tax=Flavobacterium sp. SM15 TaxID=2908005 RepID=UPI001EDC5FF6|nr:M48 family metallopeptidase [Flavobacterium sp. SM15]MCG2612282.1 M48 family metallopeptidase [Flavobacterium sp. SM15]